MRYNGYQLLYAAFIELVEDIIQQQQRMPPVVLLQKFVLRQFQSYQESFLLSLRPHAAQGMPAEVHSDIVRIWTTAD